MRVTDASKYNPESVPRLLAQLVGMGRTRKSVAQQTGMTPRVFYNYERGEGTPSYMVQYGLECLLAGELTRLKDAA